MAKLVRVTRGVWRSPGEVSDLAARCVAVLSVLPEAAVLSGPTAAALRGTWLPARRRDVIEVTVPGTCDRVPERSPHSTRGEVRVRRRVVDNADIESVRGLPVTTAARTWIDLAEILDPASLIAAGDWTLASGSTAEELQHQIAKARHRRGVRLARTCLPLLSTRSESRPESHLRACVVLGGYPGVEVNVDIYDSHGGWIGRPDLLLREQCLALEYQGVDHAQPERMRRDMTRFGELRLAGIDVLLFGPAEVFTHPDRVPVLIRSTLARRARTG